MSRFILIALCALFLAPAIPAAVDNTSAQRKAQKSNRSAARRYNKSQRKALRAQRKAVKHIKRVNHS